MPDTDPHLLSYLTSSFNADEDVWRSGPDRLLVANPEAARDVLGNRRNTIVDTSDFFHTRNGVLGPRVAQVSIGRAGRALLNKHLAAHREDLPGLVRDRFAPASSWPDAGNLLIWDHLRHALLHPETSRDLRDLVFAVVTRAVMAGARQRHSALSRHVFRRKVKRLLAKEVLARRAEAVPEPRDLFDVAVTGAGPSAQVDDVAEVYLSFLFATVGSIGFALGWAVYLLGIHPESCQDKPEWIVKEAMRMWPVAWLFAREPSHEHTLAGVAVSPRDQLEVCTYLVHRHPRYWERPDEFLPSRWAKSPSGLAYLPFGAGPHACPGANATTTLLEDLIRIMTGDWRFSVVTDDNRPHLGPALAPPRFAVEMHGNVKERG